MDWRFDQDDFLEAIHNIPIFARLYEGNYTQDEITAIETKYHKKSNTWLIYGKQKDMANL